MKTIRYSTRSFPVGSGNKTPSREKPGWRIRSYILIVCMTFVPLNLLVSLTGISSANTATKVQKPLPSEGAVALDPNSPAVQQLLKAQISVIDANQAPPAKENSNRLKQVIEQIRSLQLESERPQQAAAPSTVRIKAVVTDPGVKESDATIRSEDPNKVIEPVASRRVVAGETLKLLKDLLPHPEKLDRPLELGEVLFFSGDLTDAAVFYREALTRTDPNDKNASGDRAWILFQIGNCLRNSDRPTASKMYGQLLSEYPQSPWTEIAKAEIKLIDWYLKDSPQTLLGGIKPQRSAGQ